MAGVSIYNAEGKPVHMYVPLKGGYVCGEDFCDSCGCCIHCFPDCCLDGCWLVWYEDTDAEKIAARADLSDD